MASNKIIVRAFECFERLRSHSHIEEKWVAHMIAVDATTKGTARKGSPFAHYRLELTPGRDATEARDRAYRDGEPYEYGDRLTVLLNEVRRQSRMVDEGMSLDKCCVGKPDAGETWQQFRSAEEAQARHRIVSKVTVTPMTFAVEAAALKFMRRSVHEEFGGDSMVEAVYEGPLTLNALAGRATISPFNKDLVEVEENVDLFTGDDDSFRERRRRKQRAKETAAVAAARLGPDECYVKAHHPSRKTMLVGTVFGLVIDDPEKTDLEVMEQFYRAAKDSEVDTISAYAGQAVTDCNMFTTIVTNVRWADEHMLWVYGEVGEWLGRHDHGDHSGSRVGRSEPVGDGLAKAVKSVIKPKIGEDQDHA